MGQAQVSASALHITSDFDTLPLPPLQWIYKEGTQALSIDDVMAGDFKDATLIDLSDGEPFFSTMHRGFWFKVRLSTDVAIKPFGLAMYSDGDCWPFEPTYVTVESYQMKPSGIVKGYSGTAATYSERDYPQHLYPSMIKVDLTVNDTIEIWCRVVRAIGCNIQADLQLLGNSVTSQPTFYTANFFGHNLLFGASFALLIIGILLYYLFREPIYLWFSVFLVIIISYRLSLNVAPQLFTLFLQENPRIINLVMGVLGASTMASLLQFGRVYINTKVKYPKIHRLFGWAMATLLALAIIGTVLRFVPAFANSWWNIFNRVSVSIVMLICVGVLTYFLFSKDKLARVFSIGAIAPYMVVLWGLIYVYIFGATETPNVDLMLTFGSVLSLTLTLVYRFRGLMDEREKAEKEKAYAELANTQQALKMEIASKFFSNITHEFRTPLTLILEPVRQLLETKLAQPVAEKLTLVKGNSEKLLSLVNQLLDLSKIEQNQMQLDLQFNNIHKVARPIFSSFEVLAKKKGVQLKMKGDRKISSCLLDQAKVERIIFNLLSNAIKFTENGSIELHLQEKAEQLIIIVKDTGIGIAPNDLASIFDRFHQVDSSNTRRNEGTGIGLSLVKELVELMEGTVDVESKEGKGTTFTVTLPMVGIGKGEQSTTQQKDTSLTAPTSPTILSSEANAHDGDKPIVLIVEDNHELRAFVRQSLNKEYQVIEASNGQEGIDKAKALIPDLIVSDVMMPQKDGLELTDTLKREELTSHIPIILLTAKSKANSKIAGLSIGADAYITKPFNTNELLVRIEKLIELRKLLQVKYSKELHIQTASEATPKAKATTAETIGQIDGEFLRKLNVLLHEEMSNANLSIEDIAKRVFMSRSQLFRKVKALTGQSPTDFIRNFRLDQAHQLLKDGQGSVTEICERVGIGSERYFVSRFIERFGVSPRKF